LPVRKELIPCGMSSFFIYNWLPFYPISCYNKKQHKIERGETVKLKFTKMHGCGNDYVYVNCMEKNLPHPEKISAYVSHRRFGIGSDGLICICPSDKADFRMSMFNADTSEGKMCGNGIRCVAKYVYDKNLTDKTTIDVETLSGIKTIEMTAKDGKVTKAVVDMGEPITRAKLVPMTCKEEIFQDLDLQLDNKTIIKGTAVSMGNPHFVTFVDDVDNYDVEGIGKLIEHHPAFPERVNAEFVELVGPNEVKFRVWERGSGETWACGTGACAVAYTCVALGKAGKKDEYLTVQAKGGTLEVKHAKNNHIFLKGPATTSFEGEIDIPDEILK
jgi:diaminopimelate epimerase